MKINEKIIGKAKLSSAEAKVIRVYYDLPTAGKKTKKWLKGLTPTKRSALLSSAERKIREASKGAKG